jgi:predicted  nucleic acid-binding Zn-ribbon protein
MGSTPPLASTAGLEAAVEAVVQEIAAVEQEIANVEKKIEVMKGNVDSATDTMMKEYMISNVKLLGDEENKLRNEKNKLRDKEATLLRFDTNVKASPPASTAGA